MCWICKWAYSVTSCLVNCSIKAIPKSKFCCYSVVYLEQTHSCYPDITYVTDWTLCGILVLFFCWFLFCLFAVQLWTHVWTTVDMIMLKNIVFHIRYTVEPVRCRSCTFWESGGRSAGGMMDFTPSGEQSSLYQFIWGLYRAN